VAAAFGIAVSLCSGTRQNFGTMAKSFHAGNSAKNAITAVLLAQKNFTSSCTPFEGDYGFFSLYCDPGRYNISKIIDHLGNPFDIISPGAIIKPYPCCGSTHPAIDALKLIMQSNHLRHEDIKEIRAGISFVRAKSLRYDNPRSVLEAKFSMPYCLAVTALRGNVQLCDFTE